jgi:cell division protein FtsI (penicillin-binding protein 3)
MAFGYGVSMTATQLAHAYSILANGGYDRPVTFLPQKPPVKGTRVLSAQTARQIRAMLATVVEEGGTGTQASVPGYRIGGKTGTARQATAQGYSEEDHFSLFAGFAPLSNPRLVMVVVIKRPKGQYYGGQVAAPVFAAVMEDALRLLNVPPDDLQTLYARSPVEREHAYDG